MSGCSPPIHHCYCSRCVVLHIVVMVFLFCRHLHSHCHLPPHDPYMWHGNIRRIQGNKQRKQLVGWAKWSTSVRSSPLLLLPCSQQHAAWIIPFFCYQIFDFVLNTLVAISVVVYPNTVQDYLQQLVRGGSDQFYTLY